MNDANQSSSAQKERLALCSLIAVLGAAVVVRGVNLQGFIWWVLLTVLLGVLMDESSRLSRTERYQYSPTLAFLFVLSALGLYILLGLGFSGYRDIDSGTGIDLQKSISRVKRLSMEFLAIYAGIWVATTIMIALANVGASQIVRLLIAANHVKEGTLKSFRRRFNILVSIATLIAGTVAYFAGK